MSQRETSNSADLRRWAMQCGAQALATAAGAERQRLLKMREALLDLADTEDWLRGKTRDQTASVQLTNRAGQARDLSRTG